MDIEGLKRIVKKCDVYFENQLISRELLLQSFMNFLTNEAGKAENNGSIVLHLASPCFDAISVAWAALAVIAGNKTDVESLEISDQETKFFMRIKEQNSLGLQWMKMVRSE